MKLFSNKQCELARTMMKSAVSNDYIMQEYNKIYDDDWNEICLQIDRLLKKHNASFNEKRWNTMIVDFINVAAANQIDETVLYVAYMQWLSNQKTK